MPRGKNWPIGGRLEEAERTCPGLPEDAWPVRLLVLLSPDQERGKLSLQMNRVVLIKSSAGTKLSIEQSLE